MPTSLAPRQNSCQNARDNGDPNKQELPSFSYTLTTTNPTLGCRLLISAHHSVLRSQWVGLWSTKPFKVPLCSPNTQMAYCMKTGRLSSLLTASENQISDSMLLLKATVLQCGGQEGKHGMWSELKRWLLIFEEKRKCWADGTEVSSQSKFIWNSHLVFMTRITRITLHPFINWKQIVISVHLIGSWYLNAESFIPRLRFMYEA